MDGEAGGWTGRGKVRARLVAGGVEIAIDGLTTQARHYKLLIYEFLRKEFQVRPRWGEFAAAVRMEYVGEPPRLDLDNLAKAVLDALKGFVFFDDAQIARLECERVQGERDRVFVRAVRR
jgi:Holliday junction resolvase RusA-like endonuclease